jgi:hypothetical protein
VTAISRAIPATLGESRPESLQFKVERVCKARVKMRRTNHAREDFFPESSKNDCDHILYFSITYLSPFTIKFSFFPFPSYEENPV